MRSLGSPGGDHHRVPQPVARALDGKMEKLAVQFRTADGIKQPATLHEDELEYQEGWKERRSRLDARFEIMPPLVWNGKRSTKTPIRV